MSPSNFSVRKPFAGVLLLLAALASKPALAQSDNPVFSASVTGFQTSLGSNGLKFVTATVHFQNKTKKPLILALDKTKANSSDDKGNRYSLLAVHGIGQMAGSSVDAKFVLPAGGGGDAVVELGWRADPRIIFGVTYDLNLVVREIMPLEANQIKLGVEHSLEFTGLKGGLGSSDSTVDAGPFSAQITRTKTGKAGRFMTVEMSVRLKNTSDKPLILAYQGGSSFGIDDQGNRFAHGGGVSGDTTAAGIGLVSPGKADPQFVLAPGETRDIHLTAIRAPGREVAGTQLGYYFTLEALEILPSNQIREIREYTFAFSGISISK